MKPLIALALMTQSAALAAIPVEAPEMGRLDAASSQHPATEALSLDELAKGTEQRIRKALIQDLKQMKLSASESRPTGSKAVSEFEDRFGKVIQILLDPGSDLSSLNQELQHGTKGLLESEYLSEFSAGVLANAAALQEMESIQGASPDEKGERLQDAAAVAYDLSERPKGSITFSGGIQRRVLGSHSVGAIVVGMQIQGYMEVAGIDFPSYFKLESGFQGGHLTREGWLRVVQPKKDESSMAVRYIIEPVYIKENTVTYRRGFLGLGIARGNPMVSRPGQNFAAILIRPIQNVTQAGLLGDTVSSPEKITSLVVLNRVAVSEHLRMYTTIESGRGPQKKQLIGIESELEYGLGEKQHTLIYGEFVLDSATLRPRNGQGVADQRTLTTVISLGVRRSLSK